MLKKTVVSLSCLLCCSCANIADNLMNTAIDGGSVKSQLVSSIMENTVVDGIKSIANKTPPAENSTNKKKRIELEKLINEGKCPQCKGMGKSADGKIICPACNGTGTFER